MSSASQSELVLLVDEAIGIPDGVINCVELNRLLKQLAEGLTSSGKELESQRLLQDERLKALEEAFGEIHEAMNHFEEAQPGEEGDLNCEGDQEQQQVVPEIEEPEPSPGNDVQAQKLAIEVDADLVPEQAQQCSMHEEKLLSVIGDLDERLKKVEEVFCQKLDLLSSEFQAFQEKIVHKQTNLEEAASSVSVQQSASSTEQMDKMEKFSSQLTELHHQMEQLLSHRDQLPVQLEALLEEKLKGVEIDSKSGRTVGLADSVAPKKSTSQGKEAAVTTQEVMENLSCLACDTKNVIQRVRNGGRYLGPRMSAKLAIVARRWWCHFDDDNYVNVPRLVRMLDDYSPTQDWYLGKPSISSPLEIFLDNTKTSTEVNKKVTFWFATGGAGFCISRALALRMMPVAASGKFVTIGDKIRFPDDVTMGFLIEHLLNVPLTVIDAFHSHLEPMEFIRPETFHDQVSFSYARMRDEWNVVKVDGFDVKTDPKRIYSLHCYLYPFFSICPKSIRRR
uniref:Fringe-like glycosyltransferase domain-containing protein n=1 Tax=Anopheles atroparvus TaxID=41427 RepID=A0A182IPU1_ANOAO